MAPSLPRQGHKGYARAAPMSAMLDQCSTKIERSRTLRVISPLAGRSVLQVESFSYRTLAPTQRTAQPPSSEVTPRVRRICSHSQLLARGLTLVVVTLLTTRRGQRYDFWRAPGEPSPKPSVTLV